MNLNFHLLRLFTEVVRYRSVTRAAEVLHISQPAVSKGVKALEEQLGEALVERGSAGMRPTAAGEILARHAASIFLAERHALEELAAHFAKHVKAITGVHAEVRIFPPDTLPRATHKAKRVEDRRQGVWA